MALAASALAEAPNRAQPIDATGIDPQRARAIESRAAELRAAASDARREVEREWDSADEAFYSLGPTHVDPVQQELRATLGVATPPPRVHARIGLMYPVTQVQVAEMTEEPLRLKAQPRSDELSHQIAAVSGQGLLDWWKDTLELDREYERAALSQRLYNLTWGAFGWNPYAGPPDPYDPGEISGDVFFRIRSVRSIYPDPASIDDRDMGYLWDVERLSPAVVPQDVRDFARRRAGVFGGGSSGELSRFLEASRSNLTLSLYGKREARTELDKLIEVAHLHVRQGGSLFQDERHRLNEADDYGLHMIFVNGAIFRVMEAPYAREGVMFGYASSRFTEDAERRYSAGDARVLYENDPILSDMMNANYAHQKHGRKHKIIVRPDSDMKGRIVSEANELIETDDVDGIKVFVGPPSAPADIEVPNTLSAHMKLVTGTPDVLFGIAGTNMDTATTFVGAQGGAAKRTRKQRAHIVRMFQKGMQANLKIAHKRMPAGRMIELVGPSYPVRQMVVDGEGLGALNVDVLSEPVFSSNAFLRGEQVKGLVQMLPGMFTPKQVHEWLRIPQSETALFDEEAVQRANADAQAWRVLRGEIPPEAILDQPGLDNDPIFIERSRLWLISALGRNARMQNPEGWIALRANMAVREERVALAMAEAALMAAGGPVGPDGDGPPDSVGGLTPTTTGGRRAGVKSENATGTVERTLGKMNPAVMNNGANEILSNRERVNGGVK